MRIPVLAPILAPVLCLACLAAPAVAGPPDDMVQVDILPGWRTDRGTVMAAVRVTLAPGWKTYWRAPGDAGIPPLFDWQGSDNVAGVAFHWPVPEVFHLNGMQSIGYSEALTLPIEITPGPDGADMRLAGSIDMGICHDICVPVTVTFDAPLAGPGDRDPGIVAALVDRPLTAEEAGVARVACSMTAEDGSLWVTAEIDLPQTGTDEVVVIETAEHGIWVSEAETRRDGARLTARAQMIHASGGAFAVDRSGLRLTVLSDGQAVDIRGCPAAAG